MIKRGILRLFCGFMVRQLAYHETSNGQSTLRTMEAIYSQDYLGRISKSVELQLRI